MKLELHAHFRQLKDEHTALCNELTHFIELIFRTEHIDQACVANDYSLLFGELESAIQTATHDTVILKRSVELLTIKAERGETITPEVLEAVNHMSRNEIGHRTMGHFDVEVRTTPVRSHPGESDRLFRIIATKLHPDIVGDCPEYSLMWHYAHEARCHNNVNRLKALLGIITATHDISAIAIADLERTNEELRIRIRVEDRRLKRLLESEPMCFAEKIKDKTWQEERCAELQRRHRDIGNEYASFYHRYQQLTAGVNLSTHHAPGSYHKANQRLDNDFFDNTYFGGR